MRGAEPEGLVLSVAPERITVLDVLEVVRDPGAVDEPVVTSGGDIGASVLRRRDAAVREALGRMSLRDLVEGRGGEEAVVTDLARYRAAGGETSLD